jgi:hypothetical protein
VPLCSAKLALLQKHVTRALQHYEEAMRLLTEEHGQLVKKFGTTNLSYPGCGLHELRFEIVRGLAACLLRVGRTREAGTALDAFLAHLQEIETQLRNPDCSDWSVELLALHARWHISVAGLFFYDQAALGRRARAISGIEHACELVVEVRTRLADVVGPATVFLCELYSGKIQRERKTFVQAAATITRAVDTALTLTFSHRCAFLL